jgi:hypothetical protein
MARFCTNCGASMDDAARFCTTCGASFGAAQQPQAAPHPQSQAPPQYQQQHNSPPPGGAINTAGLIERVKAILFSPTTEWVRIRGEAATTQSLMINYAAVLAAIPAICGFIGGSLIGHSVLGFHWRVPLGAGIAGMVFQYVLSLVAVFVVGFIINALAPTFGSAQNSTQALKVSVYTATPSWVAGVFGIIPMLGVLAIIGALYGIYLLYLGLPILMNTPQTQAVAYTVVVIVVALVVFVVVGFISAGLIGAMGGMPRF